MLTIWNLVNDKVTNKILVFSSLFQSSLCCSTYLSSSSTHIVAIYIELLFIISLSNFLVTECFFFFLECSVMSLSNMPCNSGSLIFISLANLATSRYHPSLLFFLSLIIVCMPLSSRRKNERRNFAFASMQAV